MLNPNRQTCQKFRSLILENSSQMLFSRDRQFHEFQEGKVRPAEGVRVCQSASLAEMERASRELAQASKYPALLDAKADERGR